MSGTVAMNHFYSLKAVTNTLLHPQHNPAYVLLLCKSFVEIGVIILTSTAFFHGEPAN